MSTVQLGHRYNFTAHNAEIQQIRNEIAIEDSTPVATVPSADEIAARNALAEQLRAERRLRAERGGAPYAADEDTAPRSRRRVGR